MLLITSMSGDRRGRRDDADDDDDEAVFDISMGDEILKDVKR